MSPRSQDARSAATTKSGPGQAPSFPSGRPASETETAGASSSAATPSRLRRLWGWLNPDLAGTLRRLDDDEVTRLYESILRNPRGIKGVHFRMVRGELARRGL